tara:strand:- start:5738 stop:6028 length:291 start_codon:yes stop_codon:yes gene_type:complete
MNTKKDPGNFDEEYFKSIDILISLIVGNKISKLTIKYFRNPAKRIKTSANMLLAEYKDKSNSHIDDKEEVRRLYSNYNKKLERLESLSKIISKNPI